MNHSLRFFFRNLAAALLAGDWLTRPMVARCRRAWGLKSSRFHSLVKRILTNFPSPPSEADLFAFLLQDEPLRQLLQNIVREDRTVRREMEIFWVRPTMGASAVPTTATLPKIPTFGALADWLGLTQGRLTTYADVRRLNRFHDDAERRNSYRYRWLAKPSRAPTTKSSLFRKLGGLFRSSVPSTSSESSVPVGKQRHRLLEIPKPRLKAVQRKILDGILVHVPPHAAAHGFRRERSIVTNAAPHCGHAVVLKFDLEDFFPSIRSSRVKGIFLALGYPPNVARLLAGLCTTVTPDDLAGKLDHVTEARLSRPHLPQGAPTSPALANLAAFRLDCRLAGLAASVGANYTRYADDLTFSGSAELRAAASHFRKLVMQIVIEEGFAINKAKTKTLGRGARQRITGVVVNEKPNISRADFDQLKAILTNCARHGPASQNRENVPDFRAHLAGRIAHVAMLNPNRGAKLRMIFTRIHWES